MWGQPPSAVRRAKLDGFSIPHNNLGYYQDLGGGSKINRGFSRGGGGDVFFKPIHCPDLLRFAL